MLHYNAHVQNMWHTFSACNSLEARKESTLLLPRVVDLGTSAHKPSLTNKAMRVFVCTLQKYE